MKECTYFLMKTHFRAANPRGWSFNGLFTVSSNSQLPLLISQLIAANDHFWVTVTLYHDLWHMN